MKADSIDIDIDLKLAALQHLNFLEKVEKYPYLKSGYVLRRAIRRYEDLWLPLVAAENSKTLIAPLDIAWIWHCHVLAPIAYEKDCVDNYGKIIKRKACSHELERDIVLKTYTTSKAIWERMYPDIPFEVDLNNNEPGKEEGEHKSKFSCNLEAVASREKHFYYQVSLPHYKQSAYLKNAFERYKKFLYLKQKNPGKSLVPCCDIELVWRTHIGFTAVYKNDTTKIFGFVLDHEDTTSIRRFGSKLVSFERETASLWKQTFNENYHFPGSMHRGDPTRMFPRHQLSDKDNLHFCMKGLQVAMKKIEIQGLDSSVQDFRLTFMANTTKSILHEIEGPSHNWVNSSDEDMSMRIGNADDQKILVRLTKQTTACCSGGIKEVGKNQLLVQSLVNKLNAIGKPEQFTETLNIGPKISLLVEMEISGNIIEEVDFRFKGGLFQKYNEDKMIEILKPIPNFIPGSETGCRVATHRIMDASGVEAFTCHIIKTTAPMTAAVQLYHKNKLVVSGYQISLNQLPFKYIDKETLPCPSLEKKEKAILLRNHQGDWAVVIGQMKGKKTNYMTSRTYKLTTSSWITLSDKTCVAQFEYRDISGEMNLLGRSLKVMACTGEVAENIALSFSKSILRMLCDPGFQKTLSKNGKSARAHKKPKSAAEKQKAMKRNMKLAKAFLDKFEDEFEDALEEDADVNAIEVDNAEMGGTVEAYDSEVGYCDDMGALEQAFGGYCVDMSEPSTSGPMFTSYYGGESTGFSSHQVDMGFGGVGGMGDGGMEDGGWASYHADASNMEPASDFGGGGGCGGGWEM